MLPKRCQRLSKVDPKKCWKLWSFFHRFWWVLASKKNAKSWSLAPFWVPFRPLGAIWLQKAAVWRSGPIFEAFLTLSDRCLRKMLMLSFGNKKVVWCVSVGSCRFHCSLTCLFSVCNFSDYFLKLLLCRGFDRVDVLHIRSHCRFSVPACRYRL